MSLLDSIPDRQQLLSRLHSANRMTSFWLMVQIATCLAFIALIDWERVIAEPMVPLIATGVVLVQALGGVFALWARQKKNIADLRESTRFGIYDKHVLQRLYRETLDKLRLPDEHLPVYIVNDKTLNAGAVRLGLGGFFKSLNGIYLNRQTLHKFSPEEIQDIMGHELGHYYQHFLSIDRWRFVTLILGCLLGIYVAQWTGMNDYLGATVMIAAVYGLFWLSGLPWLKHSQTIEFLCDDFGAQVNGIEHSVNGLLKLGTEAEMLMAVQAQVLARRQANADMSIGDIASAVENSIPYGQITAEELQLAIDKELKKSADKKASLFDFIDYLWNSDVDNEDELEELEMRSIRVQSIPRLDWESLLPEDGRFDRHSLDQLVAMIERDPKNVLVRAAMTDGTHPSLKRRILYLWKNRSGIEDAARSLG